MSGHEIWISPYTLQARAPLNSKSSQTERHGTLLRVDRDGVSGYADLFPWPELGDLALDELLKRLSGEEAGRTEILRRSLALADLDREARAAGRSAFQGLSIPRSHALMAGGAREWSLPTAAQEITRLKAEGFTTFKFKIGREPSAEAAALNALLPSLNVGGEFKVRLDANGSLTPTSLRDFISQLDRALVSALEFIEDPMTFDLDEWRAARAETGVPLALDRGSWPAQATVKGAIDVLVIKPAVQNPFRAASQAKLQGVRIVATSYLDHPVGQMGAALEAAKLVAQGFDIGVCGLLSQTAYDANEFSRALQTRGSQLVPPADLGIGFTDLLESLDWSEL